ncbi:hypothetical protein [Caulobacter sp. NIBR2454]|nr:hypothetical protein [Caulobacter sp. NIBR2454]
MPTETHVSIVREMSRRSRRWGMRRRLIFIIAASGVFWLGLVLMMDCVRR